VHCCTTAVHLSEEMSKQTPLRPIAFQHKETTFTEMSAFSAQGKWIFCYLHYLCASDNHTHCSISSRITSYKKTTTLTAVSAVAQHRTVQKDNHTHCSVSSGTASYCTKRQPHSLQCQQWHNIVRYKKTTTLTAVSAVAQHRMKQWVVTEMHRFLFLYL
jgi:hypothetical protein